MKPLKLLYIILLFLTTYSSGNPTILSLVALNHS